MRALVAAAALLPVAMGAWVLSLPRLDPSGQEDSSAAIMAMIEGRAVRNVSSGWVMTRSGWPFFERYSPPEKP